ncbi:glutathione-disulfide reductase [Variovorax sp. OV329]|uniref:glutathione-disulfide reductase n=1 Tax=Variovorax sp. OV329 TaxID=1882825 RepID=UPI0008F240AD|nr:glutathione-disulfide reductase [Variovorax sp. OV329]SFM94215.1 NADPH-glutathione reductase [Variovorax sp. OV329]
MHRSAEYDLIVIGAGSGGVRAARLAASRGARVALIEASAVGGTCVNLGCIPKKLYAYAGHYGSAFEEAAGFGWSHGQVQLDWERLKAGRRLEIGRLHGVYESMLDSSGVGLLRGRGRVCSAHDVQVQGADGSQSVLTGRHILVAVGGMPVAPEYEGGQWAVSSDQVFDLPLLPRSMAVIGGGYIATEFASIFRGLGTSVSQIHRGTQLLRGFDAELALHLQKGLSARGIALMLDTRVSALHKTAGGIEVRLADGRHFEVDVVLNATGRRPRVDGVGLAEAGCDLDQDGYVVVDANHQTTVPSIYAVGDVCTRKHLTPLALAQAMQVTDQLFPLDSPVADRHWLVPTAVFTDPPLATAGLTEEQAREQLGSGSVYTSEFRPLRHTLSASPSRTLMKLIVDGGSQRVVGVHAAGDDAPEIVQGFAVAMRAGATKADFDQTLGIHPTSAEEFCTMRQAVRHWAPARHTVEQAIEA